MTVIPETDRAQ